MQYIIILGLVILTLQGDDCPDDCDECNESSGICLQCDKGYTLSSNKCYESSCSSSCLTCKSSDSSYCLSCSNSQLSPQNGKCSASCQTGYVSISNKCVQCTSPCFTCQSKTDYCRTCNTYMMYAKNGKCVCWSKYTSCKPNGSNPSTPSTPDEIADQNQQSTNQDEGVGTSDESQQTCTNCLSNQWCNVSECQLCPPNCLQCSNYDLCLQCQDGYFVSNGFCRQCNKGCKKCTDSTCQECQYIKINDKCTDCSSLVGQYEDNTKTKCISICGDGIKSDMEQCDDGNILSNDGCDQDCILEYGFLLINGAQIKATYPIPIIEQQDATLYNPIRYFKLYYKELLLKQTVDVNKDISFIIENQSVNSYELIVSENTIFQNQTMNFSIEIQMKLRNTMIGENFYITYNNLALFQSQDKIQQTQQTLSIQIYDFQFIDAGTIQQTQQAINMNQYFLYILLALVIVGFLCGGLDIFYNLLDLMQLISYLKYINTQFPYNLEAFINFFQFAQFNYLNSINLDQFFNNDEQYSNYPPKIAADWQTPLFIVNFQTYGSIIISTLFTYILSYTFIKICQPYSNKLIQQSYFQKIKMVSLKYLLEVSYKIYNQLFWSGLLRVYISIVNDLCFIVLLNIQNFEYNGIQFQVSLLLSGFFILIHFGIILKSISQLQFCSTQLMQKQMKYGSIYEGLKLQGYSKYYLVGQMFKKLLFMISLIIFYYQPVYQSLFIFMICNINLIFLIKFTPINEIQEYKKQLLSELCVQVTILLISLFVLDDQMTFLAYSQRSLIGWICIFNISFIIIYQMIMDIKYYINNSLIKILFRQKKYDFIIQMFIYKLIISSIYNHSVYNFLPNYAILQ
ncbi:hypothetical protein pb186bvf_015912 [Paramecium bursaria]